MGGTMTWVGLDVDARWTVRRDPAAMGRSCLWLGQDRLLVRLGVGQVDEVRDQPFVGGDAVERDHLPTVLGDAWSARLGHLGASITRRRQSNAASAVAAVLRGPSGEVASEHALLDFVHQRSDRGWRCGE